MTTPTPNTPRRGRPPTGRPPKKTMTFRLSENVVKFLRTRDDMTRTIEDAICNTSEFVIWDADEFVKLKKKKGVK